MANESIPKLPSVECINMLKCCSLHMSNGKDIIIKQNDLIGIQFVKDNNFYIRRGRISDMKIASTRELANKTDNLSHIILDCSEQFTVKIIEVKIKDIVDIRGIDDEFYDYNNNRKTSLETKAISDEVTSSSVPIRAHGFAITK